MKHTPGPWMLFHLPFMDTDGGIDLKGNNGNTLIANFPTLEKVEGVAAIPSEEDAANLILISESPALLDALVELEQAARSREATMGDPIDLINCKARLARAIENARATISRATGGVQ